MQILIRSSEVRLLREIGCVDDERAAVPTAARVAQPLTDVLWQMRAAVQRNDPNVMDHFDENDHVSGCLQDLVVVVVSARKHGLPGGRPQDATFRQAPVLRAGSGTPQSL